MTPKQVDIIIPVLNRPEHTRQTLESLFAHTDRSLYNLYIIDDGSDLETSDLIHDLCAQADVDAYIGRNEVPVGPGAARNLICQFITERSARSEFVYFSDNDVYFKEGWLERLLVIYKEYADDNKIKLLGGGCHPYQQNNSAILTDISIVTNDGPPHNEPGNIGIKNAVSGYSHLLTWKSWDEFGPFDEGSRGLEEKTGRSEDWALCQKIIQAGYFVGSIEPEVVIATGKTNTYGKDAVGQETFKDEEGIIIK